MAKMYINGIGDPIDVLYWVDFEHYNDDITRVQFLDLESAFDMFNAMQAQLFERRFEYPVLEGMTIGKIIYIDGELEEETIKSCP